MALFTVILDFKGGTYISQVRARTPSEALRSWAKSRALTGVYGLTARGRIKLRETLDELVELDGLKNAWCATASPGRVSALINLVRTEEPVA